MYRTNTRSKDFLPRRKNIWKVAGSMGVIANFLCATIACFTATSLAYQSDSPQLVIENMLAAYKQLSSYQDTGIIERKIGESSNLPIERTQFSTWIKRPNFEKISWVNNLENGKIESGFLISNEDAISLYLSRNNLYTRKSSKDITDRAAIQGVAFGSTDSSTFTIPNLILGNSQHNHLNRLSNLKMESMEAIEGARCYKISGDDYDGIIDYKLWIGVDDFFIRRIEYFIKSTAKLAAMTAEELRSEKLPSGYSASSTHDLSVFVKESHSNIAANLQIQDSVFDFVQPERSRFSNDLAELYEDHGPFTFITKLFTVNLKYAVLVLTVLAILVLLGYNIFAVRKK